MKKRIKIIIGCIVIIFLIVSMLKYLTDLMERKSSDYKYADFFEQDKDFDVLFMGTSHVINAIFPMELWNDYGIVSYNFGGHSNQLATTYWVMENALDYTTPKVVVIDCLALESNTKCSNNFSYMHLSLDTFPITPTKIRAIIDLLNDPVLEENIENGTTTAGSEPRTKIGLLWDYSTYHTRWSELTQNDFEPSSSYEKGAESRIALTRNELNLIDKSKKIDGGTTGEIYLRKMIEDCQSRGIEVLLTYLPFPASEKQQMAANYCTDIASEYGINYIDFLDLNLINYQTDLFDENSHLNPSGARKVTDYIGNYLMENYNLSDQKNNELYSDWYTDYEEYTNLKNNNLANQKDIEVYLMLLSNDNVDITIDISNKQIFNNDGILELLKNIGVDVSTINESTDFIIIKNGGEQSITLDNFRTNNSMSDTIIGRVQIIYDGESNKNYSLLVNDIEYLKSSSEEDEDEANMQICVRRNGEVIDNVKFSYIINPDNNNIELSSAQR
jgi:hypothetical protein